MKPDLDKIKRRYDESTEGRWIGFIGDTSFSGEVRCVGKEYFDFDLIVKVDEMDDRPEDTIFIAEAHQDIPALLSYITELENAIHDISASARQPGIELHGSQWQAIERAEKLIGGVKL